MKIIFILLLTPLFLLSQNSKVQYPRCLLITKYIAENIESVSKDSLNIFFEQFSLDENQNNVEFREWGNEILFEILDKKPKLFFETLFKMKSAQIKSIEDEINSPISDGINMIKLYNNVEKSSLDKKTKSKAITFIKPSYEAFKKMVGDWEKKNNKKWQY